MKYYLYIHRVRLILLSMQLHLNAHARYPFAFLIFNTNSWRWFLKHLLKLRRQVFRRSRWRSILFYSIIISQNSSLAPKWDRNVLFNPFLPSVAITEVQSVTTDAVSISAGVLKRFIISIWSQFICGRPRINVFILCSCHR